MTHAARLPLVFCTLLLVLAGCQGPPPHGPSRSLTAAEQAPVKPSPAQAVAERTRGAAVGVLNALNDAQRKKAVYNIDAPLRKDWHFVPRERKGVMLGELSPEQKTRVHKLMQTALSETGYLKATDIIWLEMVLFEMSSQNPGRDPGKYYLQIFGDPADIKAAWGWRLEGHHLSINLTYTPEGIGVTPLFFGTNPAVVQQGPLAGKRVLVDAHQLAVDFAKSMSDEQRKKMVLAEKPRDVITGPGREKLGLKNEGLSWLDLTAGQRVALSDLMDSHFSSFDPVHYKGLQRQWSERLPSADAPEPLSVVWAGPIDADKPFYYRIHTRRFVIEYACQGRNHVHAVIHDLTDPLQEDLLKKHFEQHEH